LLNLYLITKNIILTSSVTLVMSFINNDLHFYNPRAFQFDVFIILFNNICFYKLVKTVIVNMLEKRLQ
jgi:hypothetical protein